MSAAARFGRTGCCPWGRPSLSLRGISHSYYAIQLAPAVAGATALGGALLWERARRPDAARSRWLLVSVVALTPGWSTGLLLTRPAWPLVAAPVVLAAAAVAMLWLLITTPLRAVVGIPDRARPSAGERRTAPDGRRAAVDE